MFRCPSCGAALDVVDAPSVTCKYCGNSVPVPAHLRPRRSEPQVVIQTTTVDLSSQYGEVVRGSQRMGCIISIVVLLLIAGVTAVVLFSAQGAITTALDQVGQVVGDLPIGSTPEPAASPTPAFAELLLEFGGEGSGPGLFEDARYLAVDRDGNAYVAEFDEGVVQRFDADGTFGWLVNVEPDDQGYTTIEGLAVDLNGNLYVARRGDILVLDAASGEQTNVIPGSFPDTWYGRLAVDASNNLYALHNTASDDELIRLSAAGEIVNRWAGIVTSVNEDDAALNLDLAIDGSGKVYISSSFGKQVYIFDTEGRFSDRFGQEGDAPGAMSSPGAIAVDGRGRIYVSDFGGINVYDAGGNYLSTIDTPAGVRDIVTDIQGNIYALTIRGTVVKYRPTPRG
jgi:sugar lactone lactonase YvrE